VVRRYVFKAQIAATASAEFLQGFSFALSDVTDYSRLTALYDQYRISRIIIHMVPMTSVPFPASIFSTSDLFVAVDFDDANSPASASALLAYDTVRHVSAGRAFNSSFTPHLALAAYNGAFTGYTSTAPTWLDCASASIQHYGVKVGATQSTSTNLTGWRFWAEYEIAFRKIHA